MRECFLSGVSNLANDDFSQSFNNSLVIQILNLISKLKQAIQTKNIFSVFLLTFQNDVIKIFSWNYKQKNNNFHS